MPKVEVYFWDTCPYSIRARELLRKKGVSFKEYDITGNETAREKMRERTRGVGTVPQIFIDNQHIGGCDDLHTLDAQGRLDPLLAA